MEILPLWGSRKWIPPFKWIIRKLRILCVGGLDDGKVARGHREVIAGFVEAFEAWERQSLETTDYFDAGDRVVVFFHEVAKGRESGAVVETDTGVIFTVKDGSVVRVDRYMDRDEALEAAGLSE